MTIWDLLILLLVAGICGSIGEAIAGYSAGGCLVSIVLGFIGALFGRWLAGLLGLPEPFTVSVGGHPFPILWSIIGSAVFVAFISLFSYRRRYRV
ncbi:MAG: GlsB/YeaQ/YmgE family stress response membrane protein [Acidobacteria bacterium]|nr:MAG: GlsB/YeaQ/YmgE family stress response membrane protein [Acidobacteriota bacterium]